MANNIIRKNHILDATSAKTVSDIQWSNDAVVVASGNKIYFFDKSELESQNPLPPRVITDTTQINALSFSKDGRLLLSVGETITTWESKTGVLVKKYDFGKADYISCAISSVNNLAVVGTNDGIINIFNLESSKIITRITLDKKSPALSLSFSPNGKKLLTCDKNKNGLRLWDVEKGTLEVSFIHNIDGQHSEVKGCAFHPEGELVASSSDKFIKIFHPRIPNSPLRSLSTKPPQITLERIVFSPNGYFLAAASSDGRLSLWDWRYSNIIFEEKDLALNSPNGYGVAFSPDSKQLIIGTMINKKLGPGVRFLSKFDRSISIKVKKLNSGGGATVICNIIKGENLAIADDNGLIVVKSFLFVGKSDPYCLLYVVMDDDSTLVHNNQVRKTKVIPKTLNPVFNESLEYNLQGIDFKATKGLRIEVWDRDYFSKNEPLGQVTVPWEAIEVEVDVGPRDYHILPRPLKDDGNDFAERFGGHLTLSWSIKE